MKFDYNTLYKRLQELAFLNRGVKIAFKDLRNGEGETFQYKDGIVEFIPLPQPSKRSHHTKMSSTSTLRATISQSMWKLPFQYCHGVHRERPLLCK